MHIRVTFAALALVASASAAFAGQPVEPEPPVVYPPVTEYSYEPEAVEGGVQTPEGATETARVRRPLPTLVRVRADFQRELLQSAEDL